MNGVIIHVFTYALLETKIPLCAKKTVKKIEKTQRKIISVGVQTCKLA